MVRNYWALFCALLVAVAGCSQKNKPTLSGTVPVTGTVTYKGQAIEGAVVGFIPLDKETGKPANAVTDAQGKFTLQTYLAGTTQAKGALPGDYMVTVAKIAASGPAPEYNNFAGPSGPVLGETTSSDGKAADLTKMELPAKFGDPEQSGLKATVKSSGNEPFSFALTDE